VNLDEQNDDKKAGREREGVQGGGLALGDEEKKEMEKFS